MRLIHNPAASVLLAVLMASAAAPALAEACVGFKWDVRKERALFAESAVSLAAARKL